MSVTLLDSSKAEGKYIGHISVTREQKSRALAISRKLQKTLGKPLNHM